MLEKLIQILSYFNFDTIFFFGFIKMVAFLVRFFIFCVHIRIKEILKIISSQ